MNLVYELEAVSKQYPGQRSFANRNISLHIEAGEIFGLLGANGAGKTTLVRQTLLGLIKGCCVVRSAYCVGKAQRGGAYCPTAPLSYCTPPPPCLINLPEPV